jgi:hypothetical protein
MAEGLTKEALEQMLALFAGGEASLKARELFSDRCDAVEERGQALIQGFTGMLERQAELGTLSPEQRIKLQAYLLNACIAPALLETTVEQTVTYFDILGRMLAFVGEKRSSLRLIALFLDIARTLPRNFVKGEALVQAAEASERMPDFLVYAWGYLTGFLAADDRWAEERTALFEDANKRSTTLLSDIVSL